MNFEHTEDRRMLADALGRFVRDQYGFDARQTIAGSPQGWSRDVWSRLAEIGAIGALFAENDGGYGGQGFDLMVVFEELGRGLVVEPVLASAVLAGRAIALAGNDAQRQRLESLVDGSSVGSSALYEPGSHYEMTRVATKAVREGDGWRLDGRKIAVPGADAADFVVVVARTSGDVDSADGLSMFVVPGDAQGLARSTYPLIDGGRAGDLTLGGVRVGQDALLGPEGRAGETIERVVGAGVLALCAESLGAMDSVRDATLEYLRTRRQFGVPIGGFQALQHRMVDVVIEIEQARSAVINAAAAFDADDRIARERALSAAKYTIGRAGTRVAEEAIQLHGGIAMTWELPLAHHAKRLVMIDHQLGDEDHHLERYTELSRG